MFTNTSAFTLSRLLFSINTDSVVCIEKSEQPSHSSSSAEETQRSDKDKPGMSNNINALYTYALFNNCLNISYFFYIVIMYGNGFEVCVNIMEYVPHHHDASHTYYKGCAAHGHSTNECTQSLPCI